MKESFLILLFPLFLLIIVFSIYEMIEAWKNTNPIFQSIRPTVLRSRITFNTDLLTVLNHKFGDLSAISTMVHPETYTIYFRGKSGLLESGWSNLAMPRSTSPISGIIRLRQTEKGTVGEVEGKMPFNQALILILLVGGSFINGIIQHLNRTISANGFPPLFFMSAFGLFVFIGIMAFEFPKFSGCMIEIEKSFNNAGIETKVELIKWNLKPKQRKY